MSGQTLTNSRVSVFSAVRVRRTRAAAGAQLVAAFAGVRRLTEALSVSLWAFVTDAALTVTHFVTVHSIGIWVFTLVAGETSEFVVTEAGPVSRYSIRT